MSTKYLAHKRGYLDSHLEEILNLLNDGVQRKAVAEHFDVSYNVLSDWMAKRNIQQVYDGKEVRYVQGETDNFYEKNKQQIIAWVREGLSSKEIADRLGLRSANSLGGYLRTWREEIS
jgi:transposase